MRLWKILWRPPQDRLDGNLRRRESYQVYDPDTWLPDETVQAIREYVVSIKGPLTTPVSGGIRSLNVALRQMLISMFACGRCGISRACRARSRSGKTDMVIFREIPRTFMPASSGKPILKKPEGDRFSQTEMGVKKIRFPESSAIGVSRYRSREPRGWCAGRSSTPSTTSAAR